MDRIVYREFKKGIVELKINRPMKHNAVDFTMMTELDAALHQLQVKKDLKALVITGEGDQAFCSGGDIQAFQNLITKDDAFKMLSKMGEILYKLMIFPVPTFALINGFALGGGCEIATACDYRIAKEGVSLGFIQGTLAITTGWGGATMLYEKIPYDKALKLLISAKKISAEEAHKLEFIQRVVSAENFLEKAHQIINELLVEHPKVLRAYKAIKVEQWQQTQLYTRMMSEINRCAELWASDEHHQAVSAFVNRNR